MNSQTTVADVRREISWVVNPDNAYDSRFLPQLNRARQQIIQAGRWKGCIVNVVFNASTGFVTLPDFLESAVGVSVNGVPSVIFSQYHNYSVTGPGSIEKVYPCHAFLRDVGEQFVTAVDHVAGQQLRFTLSDITDVGNTIRIYGTDVNDQPIFDVDGIEGQDLELSGVNTVFPTILNSFTGLQKTPFLGKLTVASWDGSVSTPLQTYKPYETRPRYKRYSLPYSGSDKTIGMLCKIKYLPVSSDQDFVIPDNISALMLAMQGVDLQEARNYEEAAMAWSTCYKILDTEYESLRGSTIPSISTFSVFNDGVVTMN